jgi:hypothetical protein
MAGDVELDLAIFDVVNDMMLDVAVDVVVDMVVRNSKSASLYRLISI